MRQHDRKAVRIGAALLLAGAPAQAASPVDETPWTILIYGAADNDADGHMLEFLNGIRRAVADDPALNLVLFIDRHAGHSDDASTLGENFTGARLYRLGAKTAERLAGGEHFPELTLDSEHEPDSADPENLRKFIAFGKARFPARRHALLIYSHADGITMCPDEQSRRHMGIPELTEVVTERESVDFAGLELCNMGGVEIAYQWRPGNGGFSTDVLLAIPNAGPPLDWERIFARIHAPTHPAAKGRSDCLDPATMTAADFGRLAVEEGGRGRLEMAAAHPEVRERAAREAVACYDLLAVEEVKAAVDAFAVELARAGAKERFEELRGPGAHGVVMNYVRDRFTSDHAFVDLFDLLRRAAECEELGDEARAAARAAMAATDALVIDSFGMSGYVGFEPGLHGVFIHFPDGDAPGGGVPGLRSRVWRNCGWYVPFDDRQPNVNRGGWAWCRDGAVAGNGVVENWFELLDSWFDEADAEGGLNRYRY